MTIKDFYEWATANGIENAIMVFNGDAGGGAIECEIEYMDYCERDNTINVMG